MTTPFPFQTGATLLASQLNAITTLPINDQTASYTLVVGDAGKRVVMNVATANTVTVDDSVFTTGDTIFVANKGAGSSTITAGAGVTINSASGLALVTSQSGQLVALSASSFLFVPTAAGSSGVVQVKSTTKTDTFSVNSSTFTDITGLTVTITPTSASNKILVVASVVASQDVGTNNGFLQLVRGATAIGIGDAAGSRVRAAAAVNAGADTFPVSTPLSFLDSPATTSATTYAVQIARQTTTSGSVFVNRSDGDTDSANFGRYSSTITVFEVTP